MDVAQVSLEVSGVGEIVLLESVAFKQDFEDQQGQVVALPSGRIFWRLKPPRDQSILDLASLWLSQSQQDPQTSKREILFKTDYLGQVQQQFQYQGVIPQKIEETKKKMDGEIVIDHVLVILSYENVVAFAQ